jgi:hypothetical protein
VGQAGVKLITFETQSRLDGAWRTEAIFNDRPSAVFEAERILAARRTPAVRVVQVLYDPKISECTEYTVFRATTFDEENQRARRRVIDQEMFEWGADGRERAPPAPPSRWDWAMALGIALALLAVALIWRSMR